MEHKKQKNNHLKIGVILSYFSMGMGYIISLAYTPIMLKLLGQNEYGLYNLVASVVSYLGLLNFGFGSAYVRYYSRYKVKGEEDNISRLNGMFLIIFSVIGIIAIIAGSILVFNIEVIFGNKISVKELSTAKSLMTIMVINIAILFPTTIFNSYITANEEYIFQKIIQAIKIIANPFIILPILLMGYKSVGMVVGTLLLNIIIEVGNSIFCFTKLKIKFSFKQFDFRLMKEMAIFSSFIFMNMIIDQVNWSVDKFILGRYRGTAAVAVYGIASQLNTYYLSLSTAISGVFIPRVNRIVVVDEDNSQLTSLFTRVGRIQFMILALICSGLIFFGQPFIVMWAGPEYKEAYQITLLLVIPVTIPLIQNLGIEIQRAKNMHQFRSWTYLIIAMVNVLISIPLTKLYGGVGAAVGTALALLIGNGAIMNWYYHNRVGLDMKYFWKQILRLVPSFLVPFMVGIGMFLFIDLYNISLFLICGIAYVLIFGMCLWFLGMNEYEKNLLLIPITKLRKKLRI